MNQKDNLVGLGHFLEHRHWLQAIELLEHQLDRKKSNRHFQTLEMCYYENLRKSFNRLKSDKYFNTKVANNLFYGLSREFAVVPYTIPKSNLGLRRYKFMTCPMRVLYYAVGVYLLELSKDYLQENYSTQDRIRAGYGGDLQFNEHGKLIKKPKPIREPIYYRPHYDKFCEEVTKETKQDIEHKVVIHLDIQNFFDELSIPKLLDLIEIRVDDSTKTRLHYDEATYGQIASFFEFVACGTAGIPQSDNNIISDFIGNLYLAFGDLFLDDELCTSKDSVQNHAIIRYVDDIYISITFKGKDSDLRAKFNPLATRIADCLHQKLGLRLNPKTKIFRLKEKRDRDALKSNLKTVSRDDDAYDQSTVPPARKIKNIFKQLEKLKRFPIAPHFQEHFESRRVQEQFDEKKFQEVLKGVYDKKVENRLASPRYDYKSRLKEFFLGSGGFDFELVNAYPMPIIVLISKCEDVSEKFQDFLLKKKTLTSRDIILILRFLCQVSFSHGKLLNHLKRSPEMKKIMDVFKGKGLPLKHLGYYELTRTQTFRIAEPHIIEQIRLRVLSEQKEEYSVALSHLYNEFHAICHLLDVDAPALKSYRRPKVEEFLRAQNVPSDTKAQVLKLFDRRHKATVSHADPTARAVNKDEYEDYRFNVGACLEHILP